MCQIGEAKSVVTTSPLSPSLSPSLLASPSPLSSPSLLSLSPLMIYWQPNTGWHQNIDRFQTEIPYLNNPGLILFFHSRSCFLWTFQLCSVVCRFNLSPFPSVVPSPFCFFNLYLMWHKLFVYNYPCSFVSKLQLTQWQVLLAMHMVIRNLRFSFRNRPQ